MAINHANCDHPRTPAGRAACRRAGGPQSTPMSDRDIDEVILSPKSGRGSSVRAVDDRGVSTPTRRSRSARTGQLRGHAEGCLHPDNAHRKCIVRANNVKRPGTHLRTIGDLPDVPRMLAHGCRIAWDRGWDVVVGHDFNDTEKRIVINGDVAEVALVWKPSLPNGVWGVFVRKHKHPITHRVEAGVDYAMRIAGGDDEWPWKE